MPSGKTHSKINFLFLPIFLVLLVSIGFASFHYALVFVFGFVFGTLFLNPDLDTQGTSYRMWGFLKFIWIPYRKLIPHRSIVSHGILIGDIIRLLYLTVWFYIFIYIPTELVDLVVIPLLEIAAVKWGEQTNILLSLLMIIFFIIVSFKVAKKPTDFFLSIIIIMLAILDSTRVFSVKDFIDDVFSNNKYHIGFFLLGIVLSSTIHVISDIIYSSLKRLLNVKRNV